MTRSCAICGWRDAVDLTDWDGRKVPACGVCLAPPDVPDGWEYEPADLVERFDPPPVGSSTNHTSRDAVLAVVRRMDGARTSDVAEALGIPDFRDPGYNVVQKQLERLCKAGCLIAERTRGERLGNVKLYRFAGYPVVELRPSVKRTAVVRLVQDGANTAEIATALGMTTSAVRGSVCIARARGELPPFKKAA